MNPCLLGLATLRRPRDNVGGGDLRHKGRTVGSLDRSLLARRKRPRLRQALALAGARQGLDGTAAAGQLGHGLHALAGATLRRWPVAFTRSLASLASVVLGMA